MARVMGRLAASRAVFVARCVGPRNGGLGMVARRRAGWDGGAAGKAVGAWGVPDLGSRRALTTDGTVEAVAKVIAEADPDTSKMGWYPTDLCVSGIDAIHATTGLPWWASVVAMTFAFRAAVLPLNIRQMRNSLRMRGLQPEMKILQDEMKTNPASTTEEQMRYAKRLQELQKKHGVNMFGALLGPLAQIPIFLTMFWSLLRMAEEYPSFAEGGTLWFTNLSEADPTYGLPVLCGVSFLAMVELGQADAPPTNDETANRMKMVMRGMSLIMLPISATQPAAVVVYWATTNFASILQTAMFRVPGVKKLLGITLLTDAPAGGPIPMPLQDVPKDKIYATDPTASSRERRKTRRATR